MKRLFLALLASGALASGVWAGEPTAPAKKAPEPVKLTATQLDKVRAGGFVGSQGRHDNTISGLHSGQMGSGGRSGMAGSGN